jgi:RNase P subunit RPR2
MAGLAVVWENPAPLPMSYHLFYICETVVPVFISRAEEMRLLSPQYVRSMVRRVLGTLQSQIAQLRMSARIIDMNRRTLCVTCHDLLQTYMHAAFRE